MQDPVPPFHRIPFGKGVRRMSQQDLPLVSIITPSYNQAGFIAETIQSVLNQDYPNIEHIVVDGGSTDGTVALLQQYSDRGERFRFVSEPDRGQSHAVNKGVAMAKGEIIGWLNSDNTYVAGAVRKAVQALRQHPEWAMVHGNCFVINKNSRSTSSLNVSPATLQRLYESCCVCQPAAFFRKHVFQQVGGVDESLHFCMDYDLWIRIAKHYTIGYIPEHLANTRIHESSKTATQWHSVGIPEVLQTVVKHFGKISNTWMRYAAPYLRMGAFSLLRQIKANAARKHTPKVTHMNRYKDLWVPPMFTVAVEADPSSPAHLLLVRGRSSQHIPTPNEQGVNFQCSVVVNGRLAAVHQITTPSFSLEVPLDRSRLKNEVAIFSSRFVSLANQVYPMKRQVSFVAEDVLPLSLDEARLYQTVQHASRTS